jgi:hypothetical protein
LDEVLNLLRNAGFTDLNYSYCEEPEIEAYGNKMVFSSYCVKAVK